MHHYGMETGLSLGSNVGDRLENLEAARKYIAKIPGVTITGSSPVYETEPVDVALEHKAEYFLNACLIIEHSPPIEDMAPKLHAVENLMGRQRGTEWYAPRVIDVDIIYSGNITMDTPQLVIPHPRWRTRRFVVQLLSDLRPEMVLPGENLNVIQILSTLPTKPSVRLFSCDWQNTSGIVA